jgi:hypothetical protein
VGVPVSVGGGGELSAESCVVGVGVMGGGGCWQNTKGQRTVLEGHPTVMSHLQDGMWGGGGVTLIRDIQTYPPIESTWYQNHQPGL